MLPALYRAATAAATPLVHAALARRARRGKEDPARLGERYGIAGLARPQGKLVWVHAASVGEAMSVLALIDRILHERPGVQILITTGTVTSAEMLTPRLHRHARHQFVPVDLPRAVNRFLDHWRPDLAIWVESELWPNLVLATRRRRVPMALVNARLSARSYARWLAMPGLAIPLLSSFAVCLAQDDEQARRLRPLGALAADSVGDLKAAASELPAHRAALAALQRDIGARPVWLAASTHPGEEDAAAVAHRIVAASHPGALTLVAPRHPVRGQAVAAALRAQGFGIARRSLGEPISASTDFYLADTLGEMGLFYRLAGIAFVGGSLIDKGGHNPFEAARLDCAILHGPHMGNCVAMAAALTAAGAAEMVADGAELGHAVARLLADPDLRAARAAAAAQAAAAGAGTLDAVLARLAPLLDPLVPRRTKTVPGRASHVRRHADAQS